ncbi:MAG: SGNH/GDSL hydrolase family protein [Actinobacteria bacterium]|nr:SGNH/GDSL hydrolase family protein [Actinomycetota bacterium]
MKRIQIVGDSLAGGPPLINFTKVLDGMLDDYTVCADFVGGDPLAGVSKRLHGLLGGLRADVVVIEAGINDVLLPVLRDRGGIWAVLAGRILKRGNPPAEDIHDFKTLYSDTINKVKSAVPALVITTITCVGEDLDSGPNKTRKDLNAVISELAGEHGVILADTGAAFDEVLGREERPSPYFQDKLHGAFTDSLYTFSERGLDRICGRRGLKLTIDGVHFNREGACLFASTIGDTVNKLEY